MKGIRHGALYKMLALGLCLVLTALSFPLGGGAARAAADGTVTVTVNFVYEADKNMVAQPYGAQLAKGAAFQKIVDVPVLLNYTIPADKARGLSESIVLQQNDDRGYSLCFHLAAVNEDVTVTLFYVAGQTSYTVEHYYQNLNDDGYTDQPVVETLTGDIDAYTEAVAQRRAGFRCKGVPQTTVAADGTTVVKIYYDREYYTVTFAVNGGVNGPEPIYAKYGTVVRADTIAAPTRKGYRFLGWEPLLSDTLTVTENATYRAAWQPVQSQSDYTIVIWGQNANDNGYSYIRSGAKQGQVGQSVSWDERTMAALHPGKTLWAYEKSDTVTVSADGSAVLNVYFTRREFTLRFRETYSKKDDYGTITARWGADIAARYRTVVDNADGNCWTKNRNGEGPYTNYIGVMPSENITYYKKVNGGWFTYTMTYYAEDLNGQYTEIFRVTFSGIGLVVTEEDRYDFEGFTYDHGTALGKSCNGAKFYYKRSRYTLAFYSASHSTPDSTHQVPYQQPLGRYDYTPTKKPEALERDAVFVGWYQNPECTGERYDPAAHAMPAHNVALYAKWVNGLYTVTTYRENKTTLYTYTGYNGRQENIEKYTLATAPQDPARDGYAFVGWFYQDGGVEKPFSYTMPITRNYDLYPKFSEPQAVTYTVHYYKAGTIERVASDRTQTVMIGTTVTEKAKMGAALDLVPPAEQQRYYPAATSTSVVIQKMNQEIVFYYTPAVQARYTVCYQDADGRDLLPPVPKTTDCSTVTESYLPIPHYAPRQYSITRDLSADDTQNRLVFVYDPLYASLTVQKSGAQPVDEYATFVFRVQGAETPTSRVDLTITVHGNGRTTVTDLPLGRYTVTEQTDWSWRYRPDQAAQTVTLTAQGGRLTFQNDRTQSCWLDGSHYRVNVFDADA